MCYCIRFSAPEGTTILMRWSMAAVNMVILPPNDKSMQAMCLGSASFSVQVKSSTYLQSRKLEAIKVWPSNDSRTKVIAQGSILVSL